ncbi:MAG: T9SS type A sorting domain-containing protein [Brumimicrobium sp.]|nr:T9SS type A sorting domain-containing protein [Brumimicrobium sp.]
MKTILISLLLLSTGYYSYAQYTFVPSTSVFQGLSGGDLQMGDLNNDGFPDIIMSGFDNTGSMLTEIYLNDGQGDFILSSNQPFVGYVDVTIILTDVNGDGSLDVLFNGEKENTGLTMEYYENLNIPNTVDFQFVGGFTGGPAALRSSTVWADLNNDGNMDIVYSGYQIGVGVFIWYLLGDGSGNFANAVMVPGTMGACAGSLIAQDIDGDGDIDLFVVGFDSDDMVDPKTRMYKNKIAEGGGFNFEEITGLPFMDMSISLAKAEDVDGDGRLDLFLSGRNQIGEIETRLYYQSSPFNFVEDKASGDFDGIVDGDMALADIDGDGDIDIIVSGFATDNNGDDIITTTLYINDFKNGGSGNYTKVPGLNFQGAGSGNLGMMDIDGDGDIDIIVSGFDDYNSTDSYTTLYYNKTPQVSSITSYEGATWVVYPNPTDGVFMIHTSDHLNDSSIEVYSLLGEAITSAKIVNNATCIDLSNYPAGVYILNLNNQQTYKIVKY